MLTLEYAKTISNHKCSDDNGIGFQALIAAIYQLENKYNYCNDLSDDMKIKGYKYIKRQIQILHQENKNMLGYDWEKDFTEDEIQGQIDNCRDEYLTLFRDDPAALDYYSYNEDYDCFVDEEGNRISDETLLESADCQEWAFGDLLEEYNNEHPNGNKINDQLKDLAFKCEQAISKTNDKLEFIKQIEDSAAPTQELPALSELLLKDREVVLKFIDDELRVCDRPQGKLIAMMIIALCEKGYLPHHSGKLTKIYSAFKHLFPDKVATQRGIEDYIRGYYKPNENNPKRIIPSELEILKSKLM